MKWPKGVKTPPKLTDDQRLEVCRRLARFETPAQIHAYFTQLGIEITREAIYKYLEDGKWRSFIAAARQEWVKGLVNLPLSHKRSRIEELIKLIGRCERDKKITDRMKRDEVAARLKQIQEEVDEKHTYFTNITATQYVGVTYEELLKRRDDLIERLKQYGGTNGGRETDRSGQSAVAADPSPSGEGDGTHGGHDPGAQTGGGSSHGSDSQLSR